MEILVMSFASGLPLEEVYSKFQQRAEKFRKVKGLLQKYYIHDKSTGEVGGVYLFDTRENLVAFRNSDFPRNTRGAYDVPGTPTFRELEVVHTLYDTT